MRNRSKILYLWIIILLVNITALTGQRSYNIRKLPFNTPIYGEYAPMFYKNGLAFCSNRRNEVFTVTTTQNNEYLTDLYFVKYKDKKRWDDARLFSREITSKAVAGPLAFSKDMKTLYFTKTKGIIDRTQVDTSKENFYGIFIATLDSNRWINVRPFEHNPDSFNCGYPYISDDGKTLFFSSNMPGGYGRYDIYYSGRNPDGSFRKPENMGNAINTEGSEIFPFYHSSGRLYFSSDDHGTRGGMDIFYSDSAGGEWKSPIHLQAPFNTRNNDYALIINETLDTGYFATDRYGSDDIVKFFSGLSTFTDCSPQVEDKWCYRIFEEGSIDLDTTTLTYEWDLGDGTKVRSLEVYHCFEGPASYIIKLNVIDTLTGEIHFNEATYQLYLEKTEQPYINVVDTAIVDTEIQMDALQTNLKNFEVDEYIWDFGDGMRTRNQVVRHSYRRPGTYTLQLGVTNKNTNETTLPDKICVTKNIVILRRRN